MKFHRSFVALAVLLTASALSSCTSAPDGPDLTLSGVDGSRIEINQDTGLTAVFFFSVTNPVALGALQRLADELDTGVDAVAIALDVDRPPNISILQQQILIPIVIDEANRVGKAFGGIQMTPTLILVDSGKILLRQQGRIDLTVVNKRAQSLNGSS